MELTKAELKKVRENLPKGSTSLLAEKFSLKPRSVQNILCGFANNLAVIEAAIEMASQNKSVETQKVAQLRNSVASL